MSTAAGLFLGIDLAERYSAAVMLNEKAEVLFESVMDFGKAEKPPRPTPHLLLAEAWVNDLAKSAMVARAELTGYEGMWPRTGIEDVNPFAVNPKPAVRVQGVALKTWHDCTLQEAELVGALQWQKFFGYKKVKGRTSKGWAKEVAAGFGYEDGSVGKGNVDLRDAYLIARYLVETRG